MQRLPRLTPQVIQDLKPGRHHKRDFNPKPARGFIKGARGSNYDVLHLIGTGGTSKVKMIEDRESHKKYALKIIYPHPENSITKEKAEQYYKKEFRILSKLDRIDPVEIITQSQKGFTKYQIVMDLAEGTELWQLIRNPQQAALLPENSRLRLGLNILLDLYQIHQAGILLIDDKTENIIVDLKTLKVTRIDFGFAEEDYDFEKDPGRTLPSFRGTAAVSAPEVIKNGEVTVNRATDIYTTGAVLRELLMGQDFAFNVRSCQCFIVNNRQSSIQNHPKIETLLENMTSPNPELRGSVTSAIEEFENALGLIIGSSIAHLDNAQPQQTLETPNEEKDSSSRKLTDAQLEDAWKAYKKEKDRFFGIRWYFMSESSFEAMMELKNNQKHFLAKKEKTEGKELFFDSAKGQYYYYYEKQSAPQKASEQVNYEKAKAFISKNPHTTFAKKLAYAMQDDELIQTISDARPFWRRCFG